MYLSGEGKENGQKKSIGLISKKQLCTCSTLFSTFICRCFARLQCETSTNSLVTRFMGEMFYVFLFTFFSLPLIFTLVAARISLFSHRRENIFMCSLRTKLVSFFLSLVLSLSLLSSSMQTMTTKVERKTRLCCCLIVPSKSPGGHAIYHSINARVMLQKCKISPRRT